MLQRTIHSFRTTGAIRVKEVWTWSLKLDLLQRLGAALAPFAQACQTPVTTTRPRTLEDLRQDSNPAWLWDAARGRIVWANTAGVTLLGGDSVFDLVDRPFDAEDPGVSAVRGLSASLAPGQVRSLRLPMPGASAGEDMAVLCSLHLLADGRQGVLVAGEPPPKALSPIGSDMAGSALLHLPVAVLICDAGGHILHGNAAASDLIDLATARSLADLVAVEGKAEALVTALHRSGMTSAVVPLTCRLGQRDVRLTLSRLPAGGLSLISVVMEDVTDRRALERSLSAPASAPVVAPPQDAFAMLAKSMQDTIEAQSRRPSKPALTPAPEPQAKAEVPPDAKPPRTAEPAHPRARTPDAPADKAHGSEVSKMPFVPEPVRHAFERTGEAILIGRGETPLFATRKAAELLGYDSPDRVLGDAGLWQQIRADAQARRPTSLPTSTGEALDLAVTSRCVPWVSGPAQEFVLHRAPAVAKSEAALASPVVAAPAPEPVPPSPLPAPAVAADSKPVAVVAETSATAAPVPPPASGQVMATNELKAMLDVASDGIIALDSEGCILSFSAGAEAIFGMPQSEVQGRPFADLLSPDGRKAWRDYLAALAGPGLASVFNDGREFSAIVKQGGTVPLFVTLGKLQSPHSQASFCAVVRDITQWKRTEQELREARDMAEQANRQKSEFLAGISHEIRTPLNAILGFSDVMRTERFGEIRNEKYRAYANDIHASGSHLLALVNDLLDLSKVEAGKLELDFTAVNVADAVDHTLRLLNEEAARANVVVRKSLAPGLPRVVADLRALRQVLLNLLSNAIKYTNAGGQVIVSAQMDESGEVVLRVKDSGIGMTATQLQEALRPYIRVDAAGRERQGTGLGLPLSKALAEANRAQFSIASEPGQGTLAEVRFPATRVLAE